MPLPDLPTPDTNRYSADICRQQLKQLIRQSKNLETQLLTQDGSLRDEILIQLDGVRDKMSDIQHQLLEYERNSQKPPVASTFAMLAIAAGELDWWHSMSPEEQRNYLLRHRRSSKRAGGAGLPVKHGDKSAHSLLDKSYKEWQRHSRFARIAHAIRKHGGVSGALKHHIKERLSDMKDHFIRENVKKPLHFLDPIHRDIHKLVHTYHTVHHIARAVHHFIRGKKGEQAEREATTHNPNWRAKPVTNHNRNEPHFDTHPQPKKQAMPMPSAPEPHEEEHTEVRPIADPTVIKHTKRIREAEKHLHKLNQVHDKLKEKVAQKLGPGAVAKAKRGAYAYKGKMYRTAQVDKPKVRKLASKVIANPTVQKKKLREVVRKTVANKIPLKAKPKKPAKPMKIVRPVKQKKPAKTAKPRYPKQQKLIKVKTPKPKVNVKRKRSSKSVPRKLARVT